MEFGWYIADTFTMLLANTENSEQEKGDFWRTKWTKYKKTQSLPIQQVGMVTKTGDVKN